MHIKSKFNLTVGIELFPGPRSALPVEAGRRGICAGWPLQLTSTHSVAKNDYMSTSELREAAAKAQKRIRDQEAQRRARERMDARREAIRKRIGELSIAVESIRSLRDE